MGTAVVHATEGEGDAAPATLPGHGAAPADVATYGTYSPPPGAFVTEDGETRIRYPFDGRITADGSSGYRAEPGRYHLYVSLTCPWAQRPLIALKLRGLEGLVSWSAVDPVRDGRGWAFRVGPGHGPDPVNGFALLREAYLASDPAFDGHVSVPALWDRVTNRLVSNHYPTLTFDLETQFSSWATAGVDLSPPHLQAEIEALADRVERGLFRSANRAGAAAAAGDEDSARRLSGEVFATLAWLEEHLGIRRFLLGSRITDADILLYTALVRFDLLFGPLDHLDRRRLAAYPHLWAYARDLHQHPAFGSTTTFDHLRASSPQLGPGWPRTQTLAWAAPHDRQLLA